MLALSEEEKSLYTPITFDTEEYRKSIGHSKLIHDTKEEVLMNRWRYPSLSIHGWLCIICEFTTNTGYIVCDGL